MKAQNLNRMTPYVFMAPAAIIMGLALLYPLAYMMDRFELGIPAKIFLKLNL